MVEAHYIGKNNFNTLYILQYNYFYKLLYLKIGFYFLASRRGLSVVEALGELRLNEIIIQYI